MAAPRHSERQLHDLDWLVFAPTDFILTAFNHHLPRAVRVQLLHSVRRAGVNHESP
jgi:hypothetical protein